MAAPESSIQRLAARLSTMDERTASRLGLRLLTVMAAIAALVFSILLVGAESPPRSAWTPAPTPVASLVPQASGRIAVNVLPADDLAAQLPGIGPTYAARIVHARTFFGPLRSAADLGAVGIPYAAVERLLPLISFRA